MKRYHFLIAHYATLQSKFGDVVELVLPEHELDAAPVEHRTVPNQTNLPYQGRKCCDVPADRHGTCCGWDNAWRSINDGGPDYKLNWPLSAVSLRDGKSIIALPSDSFHVDVETPFQKSVNEKAAAKRRGSNLY